MALTFVVKCVSSAGLQTLFDRLAGLTLFSLAINWQIILNSSVNH